MKFSKWLDTLVEEKNINTDKVFEIESDGMFGTNFIPVTVVIEHIKITTAEEKAEIKNILVKIDFANGDIMDFFKHLAGAIAI